MRLWPINRSFSFSRIFSVSALKLSTAKLKVSLRVRSLNSKSFKALELRWELTVVRECSRDRIQPRTVHRKSAKFMQKIQKSSMISETIYATLHNTQDECM